MQVARSINAGPFPEAERLAGEAHAIGQPLGVDNVDGVLGVQMFTIRREQGRLQEMAPFVKHFVAQHGAGAAWRPGLALIYADLEQAPVQPPSSNGSRSTDFRSMPADSLWQASLCYLAEVCDYLQDTERAGVLYDLLLPYAELTVVLGNATVCLGATSRFLGQLAADHGAVGGGRGASSARARAEHADGRGAVDRAHVVPAVAPADATRPAGGCGAVRCDCCTRRSTMARHAWHARPARADQGRRRGDLTRRGGSRQGSET